MQKRINIKQLLSTYIKTNGYINCEFGKIQISTSDILGEGGNSIVYSGKIESSTVAVKFLTEHFSDEKIQRFKAEYINVNLVRDKLCHVVNNLHFETIKIEATEIPIIIMKEYKSSLWKYRKDDSTLTWSELIKLFHFLCDSIKSLEENSIIHRDLKPQNILIDSDDNYVLADFGIASFNAPEYPIRDLTERGERLANWEFSAPEQLRDCTPTPAMDIYALGQILYWFCFKKVNRGTKGKHIQDSFNNELAATLDEIIYKCIANEPADRYQSIEEIELIFEKGKIPPPNVYEDMHLFNDAIRSIIPESYNCPYSTSDKTCIHNMIECLNKTTFNRELCYNTGSENDTFSNIVCLDNGNYLINDREIIIDELWAFVGSQEYNDLLILKINNPDYYTINGQKAASIVIINNEVTDFADKISSGYYRFPDGHVEAVKDLQIEYRFTSKDYDLDKYFVIGVYNHCSIIAQNDSTIIELQKISPLTHDVILELRKRISKNKTAEVLAGI